MIQQEIDGIFFKMKAPYDFSFLHDYGRVFKVFDDQDSGNICFGVQNGDQKMFLKFAGAQTAEYAGDPQDAIESLKSSVILYQSIQHPALIRLLFTRQIGQGYAMGFEWSEGECMGRMYPASHKKIMSLPLKDKLDIFESIMDFMIATVSAGYVAIDFYDGSILVDTVTKTVSICDIDYFRSLPAVNDMGRMWGSSRFMAPEEYELGAVIDEITNVFTLGQMAFSLFTDSHRDLEDWPLSDSTYAVLIQAIDPLRSRRFANLLEFKEAWNQALSQNR